MKKDEKKIWLLSDSSLANDIGSEMIAPVLPFYIINLGGGGAAIGLVSGLREGLASIFRFIGGIGSDYIGKRKIFVTIGYFLSCFFRFLLGMAGSWQQIITLVSLERVGKMRDAPRDVMIIESTEKRGRGFARNEMMDIFGGVIGTILVILLFTQLKISFFSLIIIAAAISSLSLIPLIFVTDNKSKPKRTNPIKNIKALDKSIKYFIFVAAIFTLANFGLYMFIMLLVEQHSGSQTLAMIFLLIFNLTYAFSTTKFGKLSDKIGRKPILLIGYILFFTISFALIFITNLFLLAIIFSVYGLSLAITRPLQRAYISDHTEKTKGTAFGFYYLITGLANVIGGLVAGILWDINPQTMFTYISIVAFISLILLTLIKNNETPPETKSIALPINHH